MQAICITPHGPIGMPADPDVPASNLSSQTSELANLIGQQPNAICSPTLNGQTVGLGLSNLTLVRCSVVTL